MCLGVPSKVVALKEGVATVDSLNTRRDVSLLMMDEPVVVGDYLLVQVGGFAVEKLTPEDAEQALQTIKSLQLFEQWGEEEKAAGVNYE